MVHQKFQMRYGLGRVICMAILLLPFSIFAANGVTVSWQANSEADLAGYKIYYGTSSRSYSVCIDVGNTTQYPINQLTVGQTYYFAVTAYDYNGNESQHSDEKSYQIQDMDKPTIASVVCEENDVVRLVYSEPVEKNSAEQNTNYTINNVVVQNVVLQSDQRTVLIYTTVHANGVYTVTVNNVRDCATVPNTILPNSQKTYSWYGNDETPPSVTGVELFRNSQSDLIVITFSEPLEQSSALASSNYSISPAVGILSTGIDDSFQKVYLTTQVHTPGQDYTVTINNVKDGAEPPNTISANTKASYSCIAEDTDKPVLIAARLISTTRLDLEFSEGLDPASALNVSNYSISPHVTISNASLSNNNTVVSLTTAAHTGGDYTITVSGVGDDATPSNVISSAQLSYNYTPPDVTPPSISAAELIDVNWLQVTFSEPVDRNSALNISNYTIQPSLQIIQATLDVSETKVMLHTATHTPGTYKIIVNGVKDQASPSNTIPSNTTRDYSFVQPDETPPEIVEVNLHGADILEVVFSESVDRTSGETISNYQISPAVAVLEASLIGENLDRVLLTTAEHQPGQSYTLTVSGIKDRATVANTIAQNTQVQYDYPVVDITPPYLLSAELQGDRTVILKFSESITVASAENIANYGISPSISIQDVTLDVSLTKVILHTGVHQPGNKYTITVQNIQDRAEPANTISSNNQLQYECESSDNIPPIVVQAELFSDHVLAITFSEPVETSSALNPGNYSVSGGIAISDVDISQSQMEVFLTTTVHKAGTYTVSVINVKDLAAIPNVMAPQEKTYTFTPDDMSPPEIVSIEIVNATMVQLKFDEPLDRTTATDISNYSIDNMIAVEEAILDFSGEMVILHTSEHVPGTYTITLNNIRDASSNGNLIAANTTEQYVYETDDDDPPTMVSATLVNESTLEILFSEALDKTSAENKDNYIINNNIAINDVFLASTDKRVILETSPHAAGEYIVTVNGIKDASVSQNQIEAYSQISYIYNPDDSTKPELSDAELINNNYLELTFSEPVDAIESQNINNYVIEPEIAIYSAVLHISQNKVYLNTEAHGEGKYTITVHNVKDKAFTPNIIGANNRMDYSYTPPDTTPPGLISAQLSTPMHLVLVFNEALKRESAENIANYSISPPVEITNAYLQLSLTTVHLETASHQGNVNYKITINGIKDRAPIPNVITTPIQRTYTYVPQDDEKPELKSVKMQGSNLLELTFSEPLDQASAENRNNYEIDPSVEVENATLDTVTLTRVFLETTTHMPGVGYSIHVMNVKDRATIPNTIASDTWKSYSMPTSGGLADNTAPTVARIEPVSSTRIDIVYSEPVNQNSAENSSNYSINNGITVESVALDENSVRAHLTTSSHKLGEPYYINVKNIKDKATKTNTQTEVSSIRYLITENLSVSDLSRTQYAFSIFEPGNICYTDRDYTISDAPDKLRGGIQILTMNDDKTTTGESLASFEVKGEGVLYVALDKNIKENPKWLSSWKATGEQIVNSHNGVFNLFSKQVVSGCVKLGGNYGTMDDNMYLAFLIPYASDIGIIANLNRTSYQVEHLDVGDAYYIDRDYTLASVPDTLTDLLWIRTANDDKLHKDDDFLSFTLQQDAILYVGYDAQMPSTPEWIQDWEKMDEQVMDSRGAVFNMYKKQFFTGDISLGGNSGTTDDNMYIVLVQSIGGNESGDGYSTLPGHFTLSQNYPNPFNPETTIRYRVHKPGHVKLTVYNILGQCVKVLVDGYIADISEKRVIWDGTNEHGMPVASGMYFYRIEQGHYAKAFRMILMR